MSPTPSEPAASFFREIWRVERQIRSERSPYHRIGHDGWPKQELIRFRTSQHLGFAGQDLVESKEWRTSDGFLATELRVDCMGLTGARGTLPAHYTERVLGQLKSKAPALGDFLDLFNHRLLSLLYRSWEKTQPAVQQERNEEDLFTCVLASLIGSEKSWEIYYGAALSRTVRSAATIRAVLSDLTGMQVEIRSLQGGWERLTDEDQTRLPARHAPTGQCAHLGEAMLGSRVWLADKGAEIVFYPKNWDQLQSLLPGGQFSTAAAHLTHRLMGGQAQVRYRAVTAATELVGARLGQLGRLGRDSFVSARQQPEQPVEVIFKPSQEREVPSCRQ